MSKRVQSPELYDEIYNAGGYQGVYTLPYWRSTYYPLFSATVKALRRCGPQSVLEVGCGTGAFAHCLHDRFKIRYRGFDFSEVAVRRSRELMGRDDLFFVGDATDPSSYAEPYDSIVCTEVLEHIESDLEVIRLWKKGTVCICSVPNFDADVHVRFFKTEGDVQKRYGGLIEIRRITRIKRPALGDISLRNTIRHLRWNRYRPKQLADILGLLSFEESGGWFLFTGVRRD